MIIGFTGHRDWLCDEAVLWQIVALNKEATWVHGGAPGFDTQVGEFAKANGIDYRVMRPKYKLYHPKQAPLKRNEEIVDLCQLLVACYDGRKIGGTFYTVNYAQERGVLVVIVKPYTPAPHGAR